MSVPITGSSACKAGEEPDMKTSSPSIADAEARRLVKSVRRGDSAAFQELYDLFHQRLFRFVLVLSRGDEQLAGDIVQSVFLTAAAKLRHIESQEHLWNWLARVTRQHLAKAQRQQRHEHRTKLEMTDSLEGVVACKPDSEQEERLDAALQLIEPDDRRLIESFYFDGRSHAEIASALGLTAKAVSSRLERARARLRAVLKRTLFHET